MPEWIDSYRKAGIEADSLGVMAAFGCNFEGYIPEEKVISLIGRTIDIMAENGCTLRNLSLADTMGWGTPEGAWDGTRSGGSPWGPSRSWS
jgi:hydroxymethylglutaryl-CoA lyase